MSETRKKVRARWRLAAAAALCWATTAAAGDGPCIRAHVPSVVVLPDGSEHPPGTLRVCVTGRMSPSVALHATWVDGRPIGRFPGRFELAEDPDPSEGAVFVFRRAGSGWVLEAYALTVAGHRQVHRLGAEAGGVAPPSGPLPGSATGVRETGGVVVVQAGLDELRRSSR